MGRILSIIFFMIILSCEAVAAGSGWSGKSKIETLYAVNDNQVVIKLTNFNNATGCNPNSAGQVLVSPNTQKTFYTLILSAFMSGKEVDFYLYGDCKTTHWVGPSFAGFGHLRVF